MYDTLQNVPTEELVLLSDPCVYMILKVCESDSTLTKTPLANDEVRMVRAGHYFPRSDLKRFQITARVVEEEACN